MKHPHSEPRSYAHLFRRVVLWPIVGLLAVFEVRFARISNPGRIGHLIAEMDCYLRERELGLVPRTRTILLLERKRAANAALLDVFKQHVTVWERRWQKIAFGALTRFSAITLPLGRPVLGLGESTRYPQVLSLWGDRPPPIRLTDEMNARGATRLRELGVPEDAWFVCLHVREGGYSPRDEDSHAHRNAEINAYTLAIQAITDRGGWVVRVGDPTMKPLAPMPQVVDYAHSPLRSDWMDLWLCANNRFFIGTTSGLLMVATAFHRPCALANMIPLGSIYGMGERDISIAKRTVNKDGEPVRFADIFDSGLSAVRYARNFANYGVELQENTPEEIRALVAEMMDRLDGVFEATEEDEDLQRRFRSLLRPRDNCFGAISRVGRDWLRENRSLLVDPAGSGDGAPDA